MNKLFFDIETIPCVPEKKETFIEILKRKNSNGEKSDDELYTNMSFDGAFGRICCVGYIKERDGTIIDQDVLAGTEKEMLQKFWDIARDVHQFVGHNIYEFDLPFIYKRSMINGVRPRYDISFARYRNVPIYDTMREWDLWGDPRKAVSLDLLASVFDLKSSKDEMNGSLVWPYFQEGRIEEIKRYCMKDVVLSRQVYYKMTCQPLEIEETPSASVGTAQDKSSEQEDIPF
jgi:predicted PolB exonuclease-like 3'-5' exonuclease